MDATKDISDPTPTVLAISSEVAAGCVGLSAIVPVLDRLGIETIALPTILLSNHPGHPHVSGHRIPASEISAMIDAIDANGWLAAIEAVIVGYLPSEEHVAAAADTIRRLRTRRAGKSLLVLCDPVIGDDPKGLYIAEPAARAIRDTLVPLADLLTPNRFEASWLTGIDVKDAQSAAKAARTLSANTVVVTSVPVDPDRLANVLVDGPRSATAEVDRYPAVPNGTGDAFAALLLASIVRDRIEMPEALARATGQIDSIAAASAGHRDLKLIGKTAVWPDAPPKPLFR